jgi:hypothetical protein
LSYRPITDTWILARSKVRYYGAYPAGFLSRARALLGVTIYDPVLHVCSGMVKDYPFAGFGPYDVTMDLDPSLEPDLLHDVRQPFSGRYNFDAMLADPPYTEADADHYTVGRDTLPSSGDILQRALENLTVGQRVGILHYVWAKPPVGLKNIAVITVLVGFNNRARLYSVYERE